MQSDSINRDAVIFEMNRDFDASRERVWQAWSQADQLAHWWGPKGCALEAHRFELRAGGFFHYAMKFPGAPAMWGRFNYREIVDGERIVWLNSFANEHGGIARAPFSAECPMEIENIVTFTEQDGKTRIALHAQPFGATTEELRFFDNLRPSLEQGFGGTFEQLADFLKR
ncbi:putative glutathione S-transferase-related transmembrane protein [Candidatus Burkholderia verschuerenii]|uniref:Putative glutathione S-transferase-related transmembrane protein n=1 Tax=Candidatus Burkholderia verschuerenii TaxID=242163 RepID=A0A0L0MFR2_9BURK|nr:SRPBCC domain-containing protein [Candidatus Burkholderia verschuerenii]KND61163.1 putative glutathione S-transferase-related transmembrane protein [Candidatus Burkholderia verschuerenii]